MNALAPFGPRTGVRSYLSIAFLLLFCCCFPGFVHTADAALGVPGKLPERSGKDARLLHAILSRLADQRAEVVSIQRELVSRPALNPLLGGSGEDDKARWIEGWLRSKGLPPAERLDSPDERVPSAVRPNLILRHPGFTGRTLWIIGHLDVSPPGPENLWTGSPWALRVDGDTIYGRGVEDNHQSIVAGLLLYEALVKEKVTPPIGLGLLFTAGGKEYPRKHGLQYVFEARPGLVKPFDMVVVNDYGNSEGSIIEVAEKGLLTIKVTVTGRQAHAAFTHEGVNALQAGAAFITSLSTLKKRFPKINSLFTPDVTTFSATAPEGGDSAVNQIPGQFVFHLDCRFLPGYTADEVDAAIRTLAKVVEKDHSVSIRLERVMTTPAAYTDNISSSVIIALAEAVREELKKETRLVGIGASTMATELRANNFPVAVWANTPSLGVAANESISVSAQLKSASVFARMLYYSDLDFTQAASQNTEKQPADSGFKQGQ
ncbi:M20 family metallo-hydrolase [Desulfovibrio sp. OttesenSCG-928-C14]|nr:M20 family metallo-hydrolase [Desulfovibrio sp. OttesenSCG-928-C14]